MMSMLCAAAKEKDHDAQCADTLRVRRVWIQGWMCPIMEIEFILDWSTLALTKSLSNRTPREGIRSPQIFDRLISSVKHSACSS